MSNTVTLPNLLLGGAIVTPKSGVLIQDIHTVEVKSHGIVIGGEVVTPSGATGWKREARWTTIELAPSWDW